MKQNLKEGRSCLIKIFATIYVLCGFMTSCQKKTEVEEIAPESIKVAQTITGASPTFDFYRNQSSWTAKLTPQGQIDYTFTGLTKTDGYIKYTKISPTEAMLTYDFYLVARANDYRTFTVEMPWAGKIKLTFTSRNAGYASGTEHGLNVNGNFYIY